MIMCSHMPRLHIRLNYSHLAYLVLTKFYTACPHTVLSSPSQTCSLCSLLQPKSLSSSKHLVRVASSLFVVKHSVQCASWGYLRSIVS